ncbi:MAG: murein biosynthesis integral membrane protein MurJ [Bacillota bacterium]
MTTIAAGLMVLTLFSKVLGFLREIILAARLGATPAGDAFKVAGFAPMVLFTAVSLAIPNTLIPLLTERAEKAGPKAVDRYVANLTNSITIVLIVAAGLGMLCTPWIIKLVAPGFKEETYRLTVELSYMLMPCITIMGLLGLTTAYLYFRRAFAFPAASGLVFNLVMITSLLILVPKVGLHGAVAGIILAYLGQCLFLLSCAWRYGYRFRLILDLRDPYLKRMAALALPMLAGSAVTAFTNLFDRVFASYLAPGSIAALDYAVLLTDSAFGIFVLAVGSVYFPALSQSCTRQDWEAYSRQLLRASTMVIYIIFPIAVGLAVTAQPVVSLFFERGEFDARASLMTAAALLFYALGMVGHSLQDIFSKAFYALQDTITPVRNGVAMVIINISLNYFLVKAMGLGGIALSTSIAFTLTAFLLSYGLKRKVQGFNCRLLWIALFKSGLAVLVMGFAIKSCDCLLSQHFSGKTGLLCRVALDFFWGGIVYTTALYLLKVPVFQEFWGRGET